MDWHEIKMNSKHAKWIKATEDNTFNFFEGGVRSGKTTSLIIAFCRLLERLPMEGLHLAFAESIAMARIVLMEGGSNLGIKSYFGENAREGQYKGKEALYIKIGELNQIVIFVGSKQSDSYKSIRGLTILSTIGTEVSLAHKTFLDEVIARTLMTPPSYRRLLFDTNPTMASHYIYVDFVDRWVEESKSGKLLGGVNYETCSLYENPAITLEQAAQIASQYDENSPFYKALILGMRVNSADTVYILYNYNKASILPPPVEYIITVDVGISASATTFITMGRASDGKLYVYNAYYHRNGPKSIHNAKEYTDYANDLVEYYRAEEKRFGYVARYVFIDKDISMLRILTRQFMENDIPKSTLNYVIKEKIEQRIVMVRNLLYTGNLIIDDELKLVKDAIENAIYDPKAIDKGKLERLDDTTLDFNPIDVVDALEYAVSYFMKYSFKNINQN